MEELHLSEINIYPIKSLGGVSVQQAEVEERGLRYDRRWMLIDENGKFLTQRQYARLALVQVELLENELMVTHKQGLMEPLYIPLQQNAKPELQVKVWDDLCVAQEVSSDANNWFTEALRMSARLVYMPQNSKRLVDPAYAQHSEIVSFADGYPLLIIGEASLKELNGRLEVPVPMNRFRPNLVFSGGAAFSEDTFAEFKIGDVTFKGVKPCARCVVTTIDQSSGVRHPEPLKTLSTFRKLKNKILFGQNLLHNGSGTVKVGDKLYVSLYKDPITFTE